MKTFAIILLAAATSIHVFGQHASTQKNLISANLPALLQGNFTDDYDIHYSINDSLWTQLPNVKYHIITRDTAAQYILARNDSSNPGQPGLYTRIDYMYFSNMLPYRWGFCLTVYNAASAGEAQAKASADRQNPKKGCNGFPFSRMKSTE